MELARSKPRALLSGGRGRASGRGRRAVLTDSETDTESERGEKDEGEQTAKDGEKENVGGASSKKLIGDVGEPLRPADFAVGISGDPYIDGLEELELTEGW